MVETPSRQLARQGDPRHGMPAHTLAQAANQQQSV